MGADHDIPGVEVFGQGRGEFVVGCGYVDGDGRVHNTVLIRETTGFEEDALDDDSVSVSQRITDVLAGCCQRIGTIEDKALIRRVIGDQLAADEGLAFTNTDRMAMMLFVAMVTKGKMYHLPKEQRKCPHCGKFNGPMAINLETLEIAKSQHPEKRRVKFTLPRSKKSAVIEVLTARGEMKLTALGRRESSRDLRSLAILARLVSLDETPLPDDPHAGLALVKALPSVDRACIRNVYDKVEGVIDTELEMACEKPRCGGSWKEDIDIGQVFFSPQETEISEADLEWI